MVQIGLITAAFLSLLVFTVVVLRYSLDLSMLVAVLLGVSVMSLGFMVAIGLERLVGLSTLQTIMGLGLLLFAMAGTYELVS